MKNLSINGPESECIPSSDLVAMLRRLSEKQGKAVTVMEVKTQEGRVLKLVGKALLIVGGLYFSIHFLAWLAKG